MSDYDYNHNVLAMQVLSDAGAADLAIVLREPKIGSSGQPDILVLARRSALLGKAPRWQPYEINSGMWPVLPVVLKGNLETYLEPTAEFYTVRGMTEVPLTAEMISDLSSGWNVPQALVAAVKRALDKEAPNVWRFGTLDEASEKIGTAIQALSEFEDMDPYTVSAMKAVVPDQVFEPAESEYTLSDGRPFYPRVFMKVDNVEVNDVQFLQAQYKRKKAPLLLGPGGTGKTAAVEASSDRIFTTLFTAETTTLSLSGRWEPDPEVHGEFVWGVSELVQSINYAIANPDEQVVWYGDEIMQALPTTLVMLHSLMDHRRCLIIEEGPGKGTLHAPDNWAVVLSANPKEEGSSIGRPFASRCRPVDYRTNWEVVEKAVGKGFDQLITVARVMNTMMDNREVDWAPQTRHVVEAADDMRAFGVAYGLSQLLAQCDLETGTCNSKELRRLEQVISETYSESSITKLTIG